MNKCSKSTADLARLDLLLWFRAVPTGQTADCEERRLQTCQSATSDSMLGMSAIAISPVGFQRSISLSALNKMKNLDPSLFENPTGVWRSQKDFPKPLNNSSSVDYVACLLVQTGFTLVELLVVVAIISILASLLLPALGKAKGGSQSLSCLNNLKQLNICWRQYADDNGDIMPPNKWFLAVDGYAVSTNGSWVTGDARVDRTATNIQQGVLYRYNTSIGIYHCPSDNSKVEIKFLSKLWLPQVRTRSYSLNCWLNGVSWPDAIDSRFVRSSQLLNPGPSGVFLFLDEHEYTIDDGIFVLGRSSASNWGNVPADRHNRGATISYVDGHAALKKWRWTKSGWGDLIGGSQAANGQDLLDLRDLQATIPQ